MANKRNKSKASAQHNLERMLNGSAYQDMTARVLREDAAKKQADGLKLKPPVADGPRAKRTKALVAHLKKLKAGLPLQAKGQDDAALDGAKYEMSQSEARRFVKTRQRLRRFITKLDDTPMQLFRRDMAKAGERYMCKHGVSAAEAVCVMSDFVAAWAFRAVHEFSCPSRKKGEKECKCVRH